MVAPPARDLPVGRTVVTEGSLLIIRPDELSSVEPKLTPPTRFAISTFLKCNGVRGSARYARTVVSMPRRTLFTVCCWIIGLAFCALGALVLSAQSAEWWSYGDWNPVSIGYVLDYFNILPAPVISIGYRFLDLPVSVAFFGIDASQPHAGIRPPRSEASSYGSIPHRRGHRS